MVLWSLRRSSLLAPHFGVGTRFVVNVLGAAQQAVAQRFASATTDRFAGVGWRPGSHGLPHIDQAIAHFDCCTTADHPAGDHRLFIALVEHFTGSEGDPLLFARGRYAAIDAG